MNNVVKLDTVKITVRLPSYLKNRIAEKAQAKDMSLNTYINKCLEDATRDPVKPWPAPNLAG